jgi:arylsulfatase A-like enzyme
MGNQLPEGGYDKLEPTHANTLPAWLRAAGYHTMHIGKYLNGYTADDGVPAGWAEWYGSVDPSTYSFYGYTLNENGRLVTYGSAPEDYQADVYTRKAVDAIRRRAPHGPFLLSVAYLAPHSGQPREPGDPVGMPTPVPAPRHQHAFDSEPLPAPPSLNELDVSDKPASIRNKPLLAPAELAAIQENYRQRLESLLAIDEGVAAIVGALRASGELSNTVVIFTADNGFFHGEHRIPTGKVLLYEPSIRVPLLVRGPGVPRGRVFPQLVGNIDVAPTIVDVAHAKAGRRFDGRSLYDLFEKPSTGWRDAIVVENQRSRGLRTARYLYAEHSTGERELYDLASDPHELTNLASNPAYSSVQADLAPGGSLPWPRRRPRATASSSACRRSAAGATAAGSACARASSAATRISCGASTSGSAGLLLRGTTPCRSIRCSSRRAPGRWRSGRTSCSRMAV